MGSGEGRNVLSHPFSPTANRDKVKSDSYYNTSIDAWHAAFEFSRPDFYKNFFQCWYFLMLQRNSLNTSNELEKFTKLKHGSFIIDCWNIHRSVHQQVISQLMGEWYRFCGIDGMSANVPPPRQWQTIALLPDEGSASLHDKQDYHFSVISGERIVLAWHSQSSELRLKLWLCVRNLEHRVYLLRMCFSWEIPVSCGWYLDTLALLTSK